MDDSHSRPVIVTRRTSTKLHEDTGTTSLKKGTLSYNIQVTIPVILDRIHNGQANPPSPWILHA